MAGLEQSLGMGLQQVLSPQMQQSLHILQAPSFELRVMAGQELEANPVLEEQEPERDADDSENDADGDLEDLSLLDEQWRDYMAQSGTYDGRSSEAQERREFLMNSLTGPTSLQQHLMDQMGLLEIDPEDQEVAEVILGNLNEAGLLDATVDELAALSNTPVDRVEKVLSDIQSLDPVGVAARDLRECLMIQLRRLGKAEGLEARIVSGHLDEFLRRKFPDVAKRLGVSVQDVQAAADFISTLEPRPARQFSSTVHQVLLPDIIVEAEGDEFIVSLNNDTVPALRISNYYKDLLSEPGHMRNVRDYIREKIKGGRFFIRCIQQRQQTILGIAREIVARQKDFMREGPTALRPMTMNQVAQAIGFHETTVSRATHGKYMLTPVGLYELKYFFTPGYQTAEGSDVSNESVRRAIAEVIGNENTARPLSDQSIVTILQEQGIPIARRTVAKYREQLGILPSHLRKTF